MNTATITWGIVAVVVLGAFFYFNPLKVSAPQEATPTPEPSDLSSNTTPVPFTPINTTVHVTFVTSKGNIEADLDGAKAPLAVGNFVYLAKQGFYTGIAFHRVIPDFMVQAGDPLSKDQANRAMMGTGGAGYTFKTEINDRKFVRGSLGVARTQVIDTNGSQFFICVGDKDLSFLDGQYTNFGTVTAGQDVAEAIAHVQKDDNNNPLDPIVISEVKVQ
jgi:peptidyl-prolyl cis-trans isomerase B (cyclophilin B)